MVFLFLGESPSPSRLALGRGGKTKLTGPFVWRTSCGQEEEGCQEEGAREEVR